MFLLNEILSATKGDMIKNGGPDMYENISIDTRSVNKYDLFIALKGERFDGHDFLKEAALNKAGGIIISDIYKWAEISDKACLKGCNLIKVDDTRTALQEIARYKREMFDIPVIAVTGSNGKTTVKDMIHKILSSRMRVQKTEGNKNNLIGVPLTLLKLDKEDKALIVEMGMNRFGEIRREAEIANPTIGIINNIGEAHTALLGGIQGVVAAKGELLEAMSESSTSILNRDDSNVMKLAEKAKGKIITFGLSNDADIYATNIVNNGFNGMAFTINYRDSKERVETRLFGVHTIYNTLASSCAAVLLGFNLGEIASAIKGFHSPSGRMEVTRTKNDITIIDDSYNANPVSIESAIKSISEMKCSGKKLFIMGDMTELGELSISMHERVGRLISKSDIDYIFLKGEQVSFTAQKAETEGFKKDKIYFISGNDQGVDLAISKISPGDLVLIKGSRVMGLEKIANGLINKVSKRAD